MASAILDRILYHCNVVNIRGESYRLKDRKKTGNIRVNEVKKELNKIQIWEENIQSPFLESFQPSLTYIEPINNLAVQVIREHVFIRNINGTLILESGSQNYQFIFSLLST